MSAAATRAVLRPTRLAFRGIQARNASTAQKAANAVSETASNIKSKAAEGLTKVQSSAGESVSNATSAVSNAASNVQGRTGRMIHAVQSVIPPTVYYSKVALELGKILVKGQKMSPPSVSHFQAHLQPVVDVIRTPSSLQNYTSSTLSPGNMLSSIRNMSGAQAAAVGVVIAEVIGFFTVGEIIGKMKVVGYRSAEPDHGHRGAEVEKI